ncbi:MFS transporter [Corynebacterium bovis]
MGASLGVGAASAQLGVSTYMLAATAGIILSTTSLRRWGSRRVWLASVVVFAVASVGVGLSPTLPVFVATRVIQGLACGFIMPAVQHLASQIVGRAGMRAALATVGLPAVIAPAFGPLLGGVLVGAVGWRAVSSRDRGGRPTRSSSSPPGSSSRRWGRWGSRLSRRGRR